MAQYYKLFMIHARLVFKTPEAKKKAQRALSGAKWEQHGWQGTVCTCTIQTHEKQPDHAPNGSIEALL